MGKRWTRVIGTMVLGLLLAFPAAAQEPGDTVRLSLDEAVRRATESSEEVRLAEAQVALASAQVTSARSQALPQLDASVGYTKTLASPFESAGEIQLPDSLRFEPDPSRPLEERVQYLEDRVPFAALGGLGALFSDLPFGQENAYAAYLNGSQLLFSGGRVQASVNIARNARRAAQLGLEEQRAEMALEVRRAYLQAQLAERLVEISNEALDQAERFLAQERLRLDAGQASELDVMRAEVARDNLRPQQVASRNAAELAMLNLKRLIDIPMTAPVELTTELEAPAQLLAREDVEAELLTTRRAAVRAAEEQVGIRRQQVRIARGAFLPNVAASMSYGRQLFPSDPFTFSGEWREDWTVTLGVQVPVFTGMRRSAELDQASVQLEQSRLQLAQLREAVQMEYEQARGERERARAEIASRQRTAEVAQRVYELTVLRYEQGLATQLEVSDARLALLQARTNLAQGVADFLIADAALDRALVGTVESY